MRPDAEPTYPIEALTDEAVERAWWNEVLIWGRGEHAKIKRICEWADTLGSEYEQDLPEGWCSPQ